MILMNTKARPVHKRKAQESMTSENCPVCHKKMRSGRAGSLTQWLLAGDGCVCGQPGAEASSQFAEATEAKDVQFCPTCGKLQSKARAGSLTQWIFSESRCGCSSPSPANAHTAEEEVRTAGGAIPSSSGMLFDSEDAGSGLSAQEIQRLESGAIDYHGLSSDCFPFERYRIIKEIGRGYSGIVYESWDCVLQKRVAVKTLYSDLFASEDIIRFQQEARATSKFNHPNLLSILDFSSAPNGQPYMVMEFVSGRTLKDLIDKEGPLDWAIALPLFLQVCNGVLHAHQQGVLHRDLKSTNIMVSLDHRSGRTIMTAKVIDFGIAALKQTTSTSLDTGQSTASQRKTLAGSPLYMSPDQINGLQFDERSDIYSMGCLMFEALCGRVPFLGDSALATMAQHVHEPVPAFA